MTFHRHAQLRSRRRGISTPAMLLCAMMALLFVVLAVDLAQLSLQKHQMQIGADAASLAAAVEVMDQRWLYLGPEGSGESSQAKLARFDAIALAQKGSAIELAGEFAKMKSVAGHPLALGNEDVMLGWVDDPAVRGAPMAEQGENGSCNAVAVEVSRNDAGGKPVMLWMAQQTGLENLDVRVQSVAMVDTRLHGFRPIERVRVPLVPVALFPEQGELEFSAAYDLPEQIWWAKGPRDDYRVDTQAEQVFEQQDGIAEMVFRLPVEQQGAQQQSVKEDEFKIRRCAAMKLLRAVGNRSPHADFGRMAVLGLGPEELAELDGQMTTGDDPPAMLPADFRLSPDDANLIRAGLLGVRGVPRIWPVAAKVSSAVGEPAVGVVGFVAGSVVDCFTEESGDLLIVIQPCLLRTPTALTSEASLRNPWIGKLLLIR